MNSDEWMFTEFQECGDSCTFFRLDSSLRGSFLQKEKKQFMYTYDA